MLRRTPFVIIIAILPAFIGSFAWSMDDAAEGRIIADRWCSSCHLVSRDQTNAPGDAPPFETVAQRPQSEIDTLKDFLAHPHPPMPNLSLTRQEVRDVLAYIASLRH